MNIDGLDELLTPNEMATIYTKFREDVSHFAARFDRMGRSVIEISVQDLETEEVK